MGDDEDEDQSMQVKKLPRAKKVSKVQITHSEPRTPPGPRLFDSSTSKKTKTRKQPRVKKLVKKHLKHQGWRAVHGKHHKKDMMLSEAKHAPKSTKHHLKKV